MIQDYLAMNASLQRYPHLNVRWNATQIDMFKVKSQHMQNVFDLIKQDYGSTDGRLRNALGVIEDLRAKLCHPFLLE